MKKVALIFVMAFAIATVSAETSVCIALDNAFNDFFSEYREHDPTFMCSVGVKDGRVADEDMTASSSWDANHGPQYGRLYNQVSFSKPSYMGAWAAGAARNNDYLQVDLRTAKNVTGVVTQGRARNDVDQWVTSYKVSYSNDGTNFHFVDCAKVFLGNSDRQSLKVNKFDTPVTGRYFRIIVASYHDHPVMRMDLLTC